MAEPLIVYGFETSNNFKVRVGLGYKGIPYEFRTIEPSDRTEPMRLTGQPMTPVMVHGDVVLFDSAAILRYLDANFPDTPQLYGGGYETLREIESWEGWARTEMAAPLLTVVRQRISGVEDPAAREEAIGQMSSVCARLESRLADHEWLVGDQMTAADVTCAPVIHRVRVADILPLPAALEHTLAWTARVMQYDSGS